METIHLQIEKSGRNGKIVTVIRGFTRDLLYIKELMSRIKRSCGTGGTMKDRVVEIQGDFRTRIRGILVEEGFQVKG